MSKLYTAIIIDDEPMAREILESHLAKMDTMNLIGSYKSASEGFSIISKQKVDLIFLDINMPEITGLMFANAIKGMAQVIFTTAHREYAVEGFDLQAVDYLLKPISLERFMAAVNKFIQLQGTQTITDQHDFTFFRCERKMVKVDFDSVNHVESCGDYIKIHTVGEVIITRETMTNVSEKLPEAQFLRTHRSFIIALDKIDSYTNEHINIGRTAVPISRTYRDGVMSRLMAVK